MTNAQKIPDTFVANFRRLCEQVFRERLVPIDGAHEVLARIIHEFGNS